MKQKRFFLSKEELKFYLKDYPSSLALNKYNMTMQQTTSKYINYTCHNCKQEYSKIKYYETYSINGKKHFCSRECFFKYLKRNSKHLNNNWELIRNLILEIRGAKCELCNSTSRIVIHHIDGTGGLEDHEHANNKPENLQVLCQSCHARLEGKIWRDKMATYTSVCK